MNELEEIIKEKIAEKKATCGTPLSFEDFVSMALYHQDFGYYMSQKEKIGKDGDYYTSSNVSEILAIVLAEYFIGIKSDLKLDILEIVEYGAGTGQMAFDIMNLFRENEFFDYRYTIIEISPSMIDKQKEILKNFRNVNWFSHDSMAKHRIEGVVFSNEFFDALPFRRVVNRSGSLKEIYIDCDENGSLVENEITASKRIQDYMNKYAADMIDDQIVEVNLKAHQWLKKISTLIKKGYAITIDYGYLSQDLYDLSRPEGTAICFFKHKASSNYYDNVGEQDITSSVNFSALIDEGREYGLAKVFFGPQGEFLQKFGAFNILKKQISEISSPVEKFKKQLSFKNLLLPQGMGERFKVLIQKKTN